MLIIFIWCVCTVQPVVTSWANIASQPPKKLDSNDKTINCNSMQV